MRKIEKGERGSSESKRAHVENGKKPRLKEAHTRLENPPFTVPRGPGWCCRAGTQTFVLRASFSAQASPYTTQGQLGSSAVGLRCLPRSAPEITVLNGSIGTGLNPPHAGPGGRVHV